LSEESISVRAMRGSAYSVGASVVTLGLGFLRSVLLARFLLPEHFGVMTLALFYANLVHMVLSLGLSRAMVHRKDVDRAVVGTYFTLNLLLVGLALVAMLLLVPVVGKTYPRMPLLAPLLLVLAGIDTVKGLNTFQETLLSKELGFRRLALTDVVSSITMTLAAPLAAWQGWGVWSLVVEQAAGHLARGSTLWLFGHPVVPRISWDKDIARWFWDFGTKAWVGSKLDFVLDRFDDFWTGTVLGKTPLGFYSRAYEFARYPRRVIANPLAAVFFPTFASLQSDRLGLSKAFFRVTSLMVRFGFWFSLVFILTAPEFVRIFLGEKWLPMLATFQLMIVYTLGDPLGVIASNLLMATGHPELLNRTRVVQMVIFVPAVIVLAHLAGIVGVAIAADLMMAVGVVILFLLVRRFVDYSVRTLWLYPAVALAVTAGMVLGLSPLWRLLPLWWRFIGKGALITGVYGLLLWLGERKLWREGKRIVMQILQAGAES
jgi:O-antigen/teichoic acid export membrane protein